MTIRMLRLPNSVKHLDTEEVERIAQVIYEQSILWDASIRLRVIQALLAVPFFAI